MLVSTNLVSTAVIRSGLHLYFKVTSLYGTEYTHTNPVLHTRAHIYLYIILSLKTSPNSLSEIEREAEGTDKSDKV